MAWSDAQSCWPTALYTQLRGVAGRLLRQEQAPDVLQPTAVLHEAFLRVARDPQDEGSRTRFFAAAVGEMRRVLVEHARRRDALKRGGDCRRLALDTRMLQLGASHVELVELHDALERLAQLDPRQARVVELRFLAGLEEAEVALQLGVSRRTVQKDWRGAKVWLRRELARGSGGASSAIHSEHSGDGALRTDTRT